MFNNKIIKSVNDHSSNYSEEVWVNIENKLNEKRKRKLLILFLIGMIMIVTSYTVIKTDFLTKSKTEALKDNNPTP